MNRLFFLSLSLCALTLVAPYADEVNNAAEYRACMAEALKTPNTAYVRAVRWRDLGGGSGAEHCAATALMGLELYKDAAARLETLAQTSKTEPELKAQLLAQAAQAWLLDGNAERAEANITAALSLTPDNPDLLIDRAEAKAGRKDYTGALNDLDRALAFDSGQVDALVFRGTAKRYLDDLDGALADLNRALAMDISHADALLERGIVYRLKDNANAARQDWLMVLSIDPDSAAAEAARKNLEHMDVKKE